MEKGYVALVLHSHLPYVRHPESEDALEERWFFEAINECYVPLINAYDELIKEKIQFKITMSITPSLMAMFEDDYLNKRYMKYIKSCIELSNKEVLRTKSEKELNKVAVFYNKRFKGILNTYKKYNCRLMSAFKKFHNSGHLEIITCSATHALLPLLTTNPETIRAQIATAVDYYERCIGHKPKGIWLPECAYCPELDDILKECGIEYFILEDKGVLNAKPRPLYGTSAPIATENGICGFGRDMESSMQVWSSCLGYPGDVNYREFYRDLGFDSPMEYIAPYINKSGIRVDTGIKYYKITGNTDYKEYYNRENAIFKVKEHAHHFALGRNYSIKVLSDKMEVPPIMLCPYDTELFGHWWFEGPDFIEHFMREASKKEMDFKLTTPLEYIQKNSRVQCCSPASSSWGEDSDYSVWINQSNHWIYRRLHECEKLMVKLANSYKKPRLLKKRALNQAARELMLAESSDWPFIIKNNTTVEYATRRINSHIDRFKKLYGDITKNKIDNKWLSKIEELDNIFPDIDYRVYKSK